MVERRSFTDEFKREAVRLAQERGNLAQTAKDLGVHESLLGKWRKRLATAPSQEIAFPGHGNPKDPDLARLERENARLKEENEILNKAVGIFTARPR